MRTSKYVHTILLVTDWVPGISQKMGLRQVEPGYFFLFCQIFGILFDDFSKFLKCPQCMHSTLKNNHICMTKIWPKIRKSLVQQSIFLRPISNSPWHFQNPKPSQIRVPDLSLPYKYIPTHIVHCR